MLNDKTPSFEFFKGDSPVLVSMPHSGLTFPPHMFDRLTPDAKRLPDTDWYLSDMYSFLEELNVSRVSANYSRYVIDLNRPLDDKPLYDTKTTGLFPEILFDGTLVFEPDSLPNSDEIENHHKWCKDFIWSPYHQKLEAELARIKSEYGYAILFDAHSIAAQVPMLFEGKLPDFNFGTNNGLSCDKGFLPELSAVVGATHYSQVSNGRFKGGYITRSTGRPDQNIHAIQLELSQSTYLKDVDGEKGLHSFELDPSKLGIIRPVLKNLLVALIEYKPALV